MNVVETMKGNITRTFFAVSGKMYIWEGEGVREEQYTLLCKDREKSHVTEVLWKQLSSSFNIVKVSIDSVEKRTLKMPTEDFIKYASDYDKNPWEEGC